MSGSPEESGPGICLLPGYRHNGADVRFEYRYSMRNKSFNDKLKIPRLSLSHHSPPFQTVTNVRDKERKTRFPHATALPPSHLISRAAVGEFLRRPLIRHLVTPVLSVDRPWGLVLACCNYFRTTLSLLSLCGIRSLSCVPSTRLRCCNQSGYTN